MHCEVSIHCYTLPCDVTTTQLCRIPLKMQFRHDGPAQCPQNCPSYAIGVVVQDEPDQNLLRIRILLEREVSAEQKHANSRAAQ